MGKLRFAIEIKNKFEVWKDVDGVTALQTTAMPPEGPNSYDCCFYFEWVDAKWKGTLKNWFEFKVVNCIDPFLQEHKLWEELVRCSQKHTEFLPKAYGDETRILNNVYELVQHMQFFEGTLPVTDFRNVFLVCVGFCAPFRKDEVWSRNVTIQQALVASIHLPMGSAKVMEVKPEKGTEKKKENARCYSNRNDGIG